MQAQISGHKDDRSFAGGRPRLLASVAENHAAALGAGAGLGAAALEVGDVASEEACFGRFC